MSSLYTKLREVGHGRVEAASRTLKYFLESAAPFPQHEPVELQIEEQLTTLEYMASRRYQPGGQKVNQKTVDVLIGYLDNQMLFDEGKRFSAAQHVRYNAVLSQLAEIFPSEE